MLPVCINRPHTVLWNDRSIACYAFVCICFLKVYNNNNVLWSTIPAAACKAQLRQLGGKQNSGFVLLLSLSFSLSVSAVEIICSFYIRKQPHSWSTVTRWLIFEAMRFIIIVINYHLVPRWPSLVCPLWTSMHPWEADTFWNVRYMTDVYAISLASYSYNSFPFLLPYVFFSS